MFSLLRNLFRSGKGTVVKLLSLTLGITSGLLLIAKVHFESTFDTFFPDSERVYVVNSNANMGDESKVFQQVSGAIAPFMVEEIPEVESATRETSVFDDAISFLDMDGNSYKMNMHFADSLWFDVFKIPILIGNPHSALNHPKGTMVSKSVAEKLGGVERVIGMKIKPETHPDFELTIEGVFEDLPENSTFSYDAITSLYALSERSTLNWVGNDRYIAYAKLKEGVTPESVVPDLRAMQERHVDMSELEQAGVDLWYTLGHLYERHKDNTTVRNLNNLMLLLAAVLIVIGVLNYILMVISTMVTRMKEVAVRKCHGATAFDIIVIVLAETAILLTISVGVGILLLWIFKPLITEMLGVSYSALFTVDTLLICLAVLIAVLLFSVVIPSYIMVKVPVAVAFRSMKTSGRLWKRCLLFVEFIAVAYVAVVLTTMQRQYTFMINDDPGYDTENLLCCNTAAASNQQRRAAIAELNKLPSVKNVTVCSTLLTQFQSGNNVYMPGDNRELFNFADLYHVDANYIDVMGIDVIEGRAFDGQNTTALDIMVSKDFANKMCEITERKGSVVGMQIIMTEHSQNATDLFTIIGVYDDIKLGSIHNPDKRPSAIFYDAPERMVWNPCFIVIKMKNLSPENWVAVNNVLSSTIPDKSIEVMSYKMLINQNYQSDKNLRDSIMACCIIALIISLTGLIGYVTDEVNRRNREIAIRKVNGATTGEILWMLVRGITPMAVIALIIGALLGCYSSIKWLEDYSSHIALDAFGVVAVILVIYLIVLACVVIRSYRAANANPVKSLYQN